MSTVSEQVAKAFPEISSDQRARMFELLRKEEELDLKLFRIKGDLKEAKEEADLAHQALKDYLKKLRGDQRPMPLLDRVTIETEDQKVALGSPAEETISESSPAMDEGWREVSLSSLFPESIAAKLKKGTLATVGDMADFSNSGTPLTGIKGIGRETADKIEKRMVEFWEANPIDA